MVILSYNTQKLPLHGIFAIDKSLTEIKC